jgi:hypothetical protein
MRIILGITAGTLFIISITAHFYVKLRLRPKEDPDLGDDYYYEFEDQQPDVARYLMWSRITFGAAAVGVLLIFIVTVI